MIKVLHGDCLVVLDTLDAESIDACITDPPYHLTSIVDRFGKPNAAPAQEGSDGRYKRLSKGFMGKEWDGGDIALRPETWAKVLRGLKPGAHMLAFGGTRTFHRMACAIEDAGFEIRDTLCWLYGTGFPKSLNLPGGLGTSLKPAWEPIILARKPLIDTVAANVLAHGTGALNIDGCRVPTSDADKASMDAKASRNPTGKVAENVAFVPGVCTPANALGRWPANVVHDGSEEVEAAFAAFGDRSSGRLTANHQRGQSGFAHPSCFHAGSARGGVNEYTSNSGSASRFFYSAKADGEDRGDTKHPTVKPLDLMRWLCKLITPPNGTVLDPFAGSGTTLQAAMELKFNAIGIELEEEYAKDIERRLAKRRNSGFLFRDA